jgi:hypothetical protein
MTDLTASPTETETPQRAYRPPDAKWVRRFAARKLRRDRNHGGGTHVPTNLRSAIYGAIVVGSLLAVESARRGSYVRTIGAVLVALLLYWLAHSYAESASKRLQKSEPLTLDGWLHTMSGELLILVGAALPLLVLLSWWAAGAQLTSGVTAAIWTSAGTVVIVELVAGLRAGQSGRKLAVQTSLGGLLGLLIIALRLVFH